MWPSSARVAVAQLRLKRGADAPETLRDLAVSLTKLGDSHLRLGGTDAAHSAYTEALDLNRRFNDAYGPTPPDPARPLPVALEVSCAVRDSARVGRSGPCPHGGARCLRAALHRVGSTARTRGRARRAQHRVGTSPGRGIDDCERSDRCGMSGGEQADKPDSVTARAAGDHLSGTDVAVGLVRPTWC